VLVGEALETVAVGPVTDDHDLAGLSRGSSGEEEVDPLGAVEPSDREHKVAVLLAAVVERLWRRRQDLGLEPERALEPRGHVRGDGEQLPRLAEGGRVEPMDRAPGRPVEGVLAELAELRAVELVRLPELMYEPNDLVRMAHDVRRELRRDHEIDSAAVGLLQVEQPPDERLGQDALARVPLERHRDEVGVVVALAQLGDQVVGEDLDAAAGESDLWPADRDSQVLATMA
jgi:hypothetical protein